MRRNKKGGYMLKVLLMILMYLQACGYESKRTPARRSGCLS